MLRTLILLTALCVFASCAFKTNNEEGKQEQSGSHTDQLQEVDLDRDGDFIKDSDELSLGRNPQLAEMPKLKVRFLQNYKIKVAYKALADGKSGEFEINTKVRADDPDFKYRVGEIFIRNESFKSAARVGRYSNHNTGIINEHDLSWVSYPEVDPRFYSKKQLNYKEFLDETKYSIDSITIALENSAQLQGNDFYKEIKNLALNFYYFDYEKESYELLKTTLVENHFTAGVNETFEVVLENVPVKLLAENYFKRGEFIISEIRDYEIPDLETNYQALCASVKGKTTPVIFNTPLESSIFYVATGRKGESFATILERLFGNQFLVENNDLKKIGQFETNLPEFTYLKEVKDQDKKGKWFIFTNPINQHFLDYRFNPSDVISLSYITGKELATQSDEKIVSLKEDARSDLQENIYSLGNVSPNSVIEITLLAKVASGEIKKNRVLHDNNAGGRCGKNCITLAYSCSAEINEFTPVNSVYDFNLSNSYELGQLSLIVNQDQFKIRDLINSKKMEAFVVDRNLHLKIKDINLIKPINNFDENLLAIKLDESRDTTFNGIKFTKLDGSWSTCVQNAADAATYDPNSYLSVESILFDQWRHWFRWDRVKAGLPKTYTRNFSMGISAIINNYYN